MDLNTTLLWMIGANCLLSLFHLWETGGESGPRATRALGLIAGTVLAEWVVPGWGGFIALPVWLVLDVLPAIAHRLISGWMSRKRYRSARTLAHLISWVRPFGETRRLPAMIHAVQLLDQQDPAAVDQLQRLAGEGTSELALAARVMLTTRTGTWRELVRWVNLPGTPSKVLSNPLVLQGYLRGLGEMGRPDAVLIELQRLVLSNTRSLPPVLESGIRAQAAAFAGEVELTVSQLGGAFSDLSEDVRRFWIATALQASGRMGEALQLLVELSRSRDPAIARAAELRLRHPVRMVASGELSSQAQEVLRQLHGGHKPVVAAEWPSQKQQRAWLTRLLSCVLLVVFLAEIPVWVPAGSAPPKELSGMKLLDIPGNGGVWNISFPGGSQWEDNLVDMGARIIPISLEEGEWWRIFTAAFLHFGPLHLLLNTAALWFLGQRLERSWGSLSLLGCYLLAACGSMGLAPVFMWTATLTKPAILVGASGGIMGLIGGMLAHAAWWWRVGKNPEFGREFRILAMIVVLQTVFDFNTPNVSASSHLLGLTLGFGYGLATRWVGGKRNAPGN